MGDKPECDEMAKRLERIAQALEQIVDLLERRTPVLIPFDELEGEWDVTI